MVGEGFVAVLIHHADIAAGEDFAALAVPRDRIRPHRLMIAVEEYIAAGGNQIAPIGTGTGIGIVHPVGLEADGLTGGSR